jgi:hypothetical protein
MKTDYLCGEAFSHLGQALLAQWTLLVRAPQVNDMSR